VSACVSVVSVASISFTSLVSVSFVSIVSISFKSGVYDSFPSVTSVSSAISYGLSFSSSRAVILHVSFFSTIVAVILISSSFVVLLVLAVGGSVHAGFTPITAPLQKALIPWVSSLVATSSTSSFLLDVKSLRDCIRSGCHRSVSLTLIEGVNDFFNCNFPTRLKNLDHDSIGGRKSHINVILQDHVGDCFFGTSELSVNIKQFG